MFACTVTGLGGTQECVPPFLLRCPYSNIDKNKIPVLRYRKLKNA